MKIDFIGTGTLGSLERGNSSVLINDEILLDIGSGVLTKLKYLKKEISQIKYIIITHYHADHFLDLAHFLLRRYIRKEEDLLTIIGPKGIRKKTMDLMYFTHGDNEPHKYDKIEEKYHLKFIELEDSQIELESFKVKAYTLVHDTCTPCNGYLLSLSSFYIGYTGDTTECEHLNQLIRDSDVIFIDTTVLETKPAHIGFVKVVEYAKQYPKKKFYAIHRSDFLEPVETKNIFFPMDGDSILI